MNSQFLTPLNVRLKDNEESIWVLPAKIKALISVIRIIMEDEKQ